MALPTSCVHISWHQPEAINWNVNTLHQFTTQLHSSNSFLHTDWEKNKSIIIIWIRAFSSHILYAIFEGSVGQKAGNRASIPHGRTGHIGFWRRHIGTFNASHATAATTSRELHAEKCRRFGQRKLWALANEIAKLIERPGRQQHQFQFERKQRKVPAFVYVGRKGYGHRRHVHERWG